MVYVHKHPSLLYGFSEAFDLGRGSNIETYHDSYRQEAFGKAVSLYDRYAKNKRGVAGVFAFLQALKRFSDYEADFFHHYRFINLEHLGPISSRQQAERAEGKSTVEFRMFRPPKSPEHAHALAELLVALMNYQSREGHLEPFESISEAKYLRFMSSARVLADWELVRKELGLDNPVLDEMIAEYRQAVSGQRRSFVVGGREFFIQDAYSPKEQKGTHFEFLTPDLPGSDIPRLSFQGQDLEFEHLRLQGKDYWVAVIAVGSQTLGKRLLAEPERLLGTAKAQRCQRVF